jgi:hypothetical protein
MEIDINGNTFILLPQKAIFWRQEKTLLIGDLHLGKVMHFRKEGIAVPSSAAETNFAKLDELLNSNRTERIISSAICFITNTTVNGNGLRNGVRRIHQLR